MVEPRGPTGTVRGIEAHVVTAILAKLTLDLGGKFTRAQAAAWLRTKEDDQYVRNWDTDTVEAMLHALDRSPGVTAVRGEARYRVDASTVRALMKHRTWRMSLPNVDTQSARVLAACLSGNMGAHMHLTPMLKRLQARLRTALEGLD